MKKLVFLSLLSVALLIHAVMELRKMLEGSK